MKKHRNMLKVHEYLFMIDIFFDILWKIIVWLIEVRWNIII